MQLENSFSVGAPPERVFAYLLDVNKVAGCVPGAELAEIVDPTTFKGKVKIKVGPITVAYNGTARISDRNDADRTATLTAEGRETTGPGSARATAQMRVEAANGASMVKITTEYHVAGRVAQFGRGVMEDVSRRLIQEMANCIQANIETAAPPPTESGTSDGPAVAPSTPATEKTPRQYAKAREINAIELLVSVLWDRLFGRRQVVDLEPLDAGTLGIGVLLGLFSLVGLALALAVTLVGVNAIFK